MRKLAYIFANYLMKKNRQAHRYRFQAYYFSQIAITQTIQTLVLILMSYILNILPYSLYMMLAYILIKLLLGRYPHATSFSTCMFWSNLLIAISSILYINFGIFYGIVFLVTFIFLTTNNNKEKFKSINLKLDRFIYNLIKKRR